MALPKVADRYSAQKSKEDIVYSDFLVNLNVHPGNLQLMTNKNEDAVIRSLKNLIFTDKYERLFQPNIGCNIRQLLFEPISPQTEFAIVNQIKETIKNQEPRAKLIDVIASAYPDENAYVVSISFYVTSINNPITITLPLHRVR